MFMQFGEAAAFVTGDHKQTHPHTFCEQSVKRSKVKASGNIKQL
jgi:hypothetical protein